MSDTRRTRPLAGLALGLALLGPSVSAQIPEKFTNLKVLPKDIDQRGLIDTMRGFASALGAKCTHCHAGQDGPDLKGMDFASDEKETKRIAREMMGMVRAINQEYLPKIGRSQPLQVSCVTCHHGLPRPQTVDEVIGDVLERDGADAAIARYRELRKEYLESGAYDFRAGPLDHLGEGLLSKSKPREAAQVLELNAEFHPDNSWAQWLLGEAYLALDDLAKAKASYERSLELFPDNPRARRRLNEVEEKLKPSSKD
jgi:Photosynthetic reaction centre cytochrome C subunit/Tetratricopeptide repeat